MLSIQTEKAVCFLPAPNIKSICKKTKRMCASLLYDPMRRGLHNPSARCISMNAVTENKKPGPCPFPLTDCKMGIFFIEYALYFRYYYILHPCPSAGRT